MARQSGWLLNGMHQLERGLELLLDGLEDRSLSDCRRALTPKERCYALREVAEALRHVGEGHAQGQTIIQIAC